VIEVLKVFFTISYTGIEIKSKGKQLSPILQFIWAIFFKLRVEQTFLWYCIFLLILT
jgi:hypothetical protein